MIHDDDALWVCWDCAMWHANGELSDGISPDRVDAVTGYVGVLSVDCGEDGEHCVTFSWSSCDACGDRLGGERHRAFVVW